MKKQIEVEKVILDLLTKSNDTVNSALLEHNDLEKAYQLGFAAGLIEAERYIREITGYDHN